MKLIDWFLEKTIYFWGYYLYVYVLVPRWLRNGGQYR